MNPCQPTISRYRRLTAFSLNEITLIDNNEWTHSWSSFRLQTTTMFCFIPSYRYQLNELKKCHYRQVNVLSSDVKIGTWWWWLLNREREVPKCNVYQTHLQIYIFSSCLFLGFSLSFFASLLTITFISLTLYTLSHFLSKWKTKTLKIKMELAISGHYDLSMIL